MIIGDDGMRAAAGKAKKKRRRDKALRRRDSGAIQFLKGEIARRVWITPGKFSITKSTSSSVV